MSSFTTFLQCITAVTMMNFSKYKSVHVSLLFKTLRWLPITPEENSDSLPWPAGPPTYGPLFMYYTAPVTVSIAMLAAFVLRCAGFFLFQGFLPHSHSLVCAFWDWLLFLSSLGLTVPPQNGFSWPQSAIFSCWTTSIACFLCNTICSCMFVKFLSIFSLVPWEEG